jgi:hypothetical protein
MVLPSDRILSGYVSAAAFALLAGSTTLPARVGRALSPASLGNRQHPETSQPLFVLIKYDPWLMVIGSDSPTFALYDDRTLIYWKQQGRQGKYYSVRLSDEEVSRVLDGVNARALASLEKHYEPAADIEDMPTYLMVFKSPEGSYKSVSIYGPLGGAPEFVTNDPQYKSLPQTIDDAYRFVVSYDNPRASAWLPGFIEVMIWPYEYAPDKDLIWPKFWPGPSDPATVRHGDMYSLFIESGHYTELVKFLSKRRERQAVRIDGKKWAVALRFPFPGEHIWNAVRNEARSAR